MSNGFTFSKRLYGIPGTLIFLTLTLGFSISVVQRMQSIGTPQVTTLMVMGIGLYSLLGTIGWRYCLRRGELLWIRGYFVVQILLFAAMFWLENADMRNGAGIGNIVICLLLQCCVLGWWSRGVVHASTVLTMVVISAFYLPIARIVTPSIVVVFTNGAVLLLGHLIVSEERARSLLDEINRKLTEYAEQAEELATVKERFLLTARYCYWDT